MIVGRLPRKNRNLRTHSPKHTFVTTVLTFFEIFQIGAGGHFSESESQSCAVLETTISQIFLEFVLKLNTLH